MNQIMGLFGRVTSLITAKKLRIGYRHKKALGTSESLRWFEIRFSQPTEEGIPGENSV